MDKRPLVSLCIPTYNRAALLEESILHFIENPEFDDEVELVISDNCSTDATSEIGKTFAKEHSNIHYYRNDKNILDENFVKVLDYGEGEYLKLLNDTSYLDEESLRYLKETIRDNREEKVPVFFTNNWIFTKVRKPIIKCESVDEYMQAVSTYVTSNNIFGAWREDWDLVKDKSKYAYLKLQQVDWSYQIVQNHKGCILFNKSILKQSMCVKRKASGYNWFQIHLINYYEILTPYIKSGSISAATLKQDKHYLLQHFTKELRRTFHVSKRREWKFDTTGTWSMLMQHYKYDPYFYFFMLTLPFQKAIQRKRHTID